MSSLKIQEIKLMREISTKKLEDYLDPVVLSAVRVKIGGKRKFDEEKKIKSGNSNEFEQFEKWSKEEKLPKSEQNEAVDLQNDSDWVGDSDGDEGIFCNPFLQFEKTALKRFNRQGVKDKQRGCVGQVPDRSELCSNRNLTILMVN